MENGNQSDIEQNNNASSHPPSPPTASAQLKCVLFCMGFILLFPLVLLVGIVAFCLFGVKALDVINGNGEDNESTSAASGIYSELYRDIHPFKLRGRFMTVSCRLGCLLLLWLVVSPSIPGLKTSTFLGVIHWKWSFLATILVLGYPCLWIAAYSFVNTYGWLIYQANNAFSLVLGLLGSLVVFLHALVVFLVWMLSLRGHTRGGVDYYITRTLAMVLAGAFLWVLKSVLLVWWKQVAIYTKFKARILMSGFRLYFLILIFFNDKRNGLLLPFWHDWKYDGMHVIDQDSLPPSFDRNFQQFILSSNNVSMHAIEAIAQCLTTLSKLTSREDDDDLLSHIKDEFRQKIEDEFRNHQQVPTTSEIIERLFSDNEIRLLKRELQEEYPSKEINQIPFDKWVGDAHKNCVRVAYTLVDAFAMVSVLDKILTRCLIMMVILIWLIITEIAPTKVLVVIASPFLALTFVFGDTCKTYFQGFIFAFVTHPFDIGDRCVLDGIEVEVKRINIMTTTCLKIGTNEQLMFPNSMLATTRITNLGNKLDPTDVIELVIPSSTNMSLILELNKFLYFGEKRELHEESPGKIRVILEKTLSKIRVIRVESPWEFTVIYEGSPSKIRESNGEDAPDRTSIRCEESPGKTRIICEESTANICTIREESLANIRQEFPGKFYEESPSVVVKEVKNDIKILISFQHIMDGNDMSHSQFLAKKERQRSILLLEIKKFLDKLDVKFETS